MGASKYAATVQTTVSSVDGNAPTEEDFNEAFEGSGDYGTQYQPRRSESDLDVALNYL